MFFFNAEKYYKELGLGVVNKEVVPVLLAETNDTVVETEDEDKVEAIAVEKKEETSSFNYYIENNKTFISGNIPLLDNGDVFKELISDCSKDKSCENNVTFLDNDETLSWKDFVSSLLTIFKKEKVANPKLSIDKKDIKIEGEFLNQSGKEQLLTLINEHKDTYAISDVTTVKIEVKEEKKDKTLSIEPTKKELPTKELPTHEPKIETSKKSLEVEQEKISSLLKNSKINFKRNSGKIRKNGKKVLDEISRLLKGKKNILIEVQGHTDAGGKEKVNLWISQARANGVKKYLIKKGIKADIITAKGFGEQKLLLPKTPYSPSNRRVEIYLKRK